MAGEGHEQLDVGLVERADVAEALSPTTSNPNVRSSPRSGATIASSSPRDCRNASNAWVARRRVSSVAEPIEAISANAAASPREKPLLRVHEQLALRTADAPQGPSFVGGREKEDLGVLGAEQPTRGDEELPDREAELRRALRRAHRLVEELHVLPLLALLHVAAEGGDAGENRDDEQEDRERANLEKLDDGEAERRGRERAESRGDERPPELRCPESLLGDRDHRRDEQDADARARRRRRRGRAPRCAVPSRPATASERKMTSATPLQSGQLREVERELDELALAASSGSRSGRRRCPRAARSAGPRAREQQAEREPDLRQRERVRLLAELQVDDEDLGEKKASASQPSQDGCGPCTNAGASEGVESRTTTRACTQTARARR